MGEVFTVEVSKKTQLIMAAISGLLFAGVVIAAALHGVRPSSSPVSTPAPAAQSEPPHAEATKAPAEPAAQPDKATQPAASAPDYTYTASLGDSYTGFVRDALQRYIRAHSLSVSDDQLAQAENTLVNNAGAPLLDLGQSVTIKQSDIAAALGK